MIVFSSDLEERAHRPGRQWRLCAEGGGRSAQPPHQVRKAQRRREVLCHRRQRGGHGLHQRHPPRQSR